MEEVISLIYEIQKIIESQKVQNKEKHYDYPYEQMARPKGYGQQN